VVTQPAAIAGAGVARRTAGKGQRRQGARKSRRACYNGRMFHRSYHLRSWVIFDMTLLVGAIVGAIALPFGDNTVESRVPVVECGLPLAAQLICVLTIVVGSLLLALLGLCATRVSSPANRTAKVLGVLAIGGGIVSCACAWSLGVYTFLVVATLPIVFGGLVFPATMRSSSVPTNPPT
jgi:hypothetical protein